MFSHSLPGFTPDPSFPTTSPPAAMGSGAHLLILDDSREASVSPMTAGLTLGELQDLFQRQLPLWPEHYGHEVDHVRT